MMDSKLIADYLRGDARAFETLVNRHRDLVHGVAVRQAGDAMAEDVTQAVFLLLAEKAAGLRGRQSVAGWLYVTTGLCAKRARRSEMRRRVHEREAAMRGQVRTEEREAELLAMLDEGIAALGAADREAVVMRHLQGQSVERVAGAHGNF